jgi:hypothetical protein
MLRKRDSRQSNDNSNDDSGHRPSLRSRPPVQPRDPRFLDFGFVHCVDLPPFGRLYTQGDGLIYASYP